MEHITNREFVVFITCYGKPNDCITLQTLHDCGYTGDWYLICSDDDVTLQGYLDIYKDKVIVFNKRANKDFDIMDNFDNDKCVVYARNKCFDFAKERGYKYFVELDDDYIDFFVRWKHENSLKRSHFIGSLNDVFNAYIDFLSCSDSIQCVCLPQGGDFIGGLGANLVKRKYLRKCMNSQICKVSDRFEFKGRINEDVNAVLNASSYGKVHIQFFEDTGGVVIDQRQTQTTGGLTNIYLDLGTYVKSFYSVMLMPSAVQINMMGDTHLRIHHHVNDQYAHPKIISCYYKKEE